LAAETPEEMQDIINGYERRAGALLEQIDQIGWYMRGGITRNEAWSLSLSERESIFKLINENIKRTKESKMPLL
jgi:hypothetical protein